MASAVLSADLETQLRNACQEAVQPMRKSVSFSGLPSEQAPDCTLSGTASLPQLRKYNSSQKMSKERGVCPVLRSALVEQRVYQLPTAMSLRRETQAKSKVLPPLGYPKSGFRQDSLVPWTKSDNQSDSLSSLLKQPSLPQFPPKWLLESYPSHGTRTERTNFDDEAQKLWARLNLDPTKHKSHQYNSIDAIWCHPKTEAKLYVGNQTAAKSLPLLKEHNVTHIVNCTDSIPNFHESATGSPITYFRFDITRHHTFENEAEVVAFIQPVLDFVSDALLRGQNVMVHCLAGAHRAGTMGIICLMYFALLSVKEATYMAKQCRPLIDPISDFPKLLERLERGWQTRKGITS